ncbi:MAG: SurA N-terminal domain-containing protein [Candidatus Omnitrophota bacterium]
MVMHILRSKKVARRVLIGILILILPAFVLWGIGSFSQKPPLIGTIENQKVFPEDFARSLQGIKIQALLSYSGDYNSLTKLLDNRTLLNFMAWERLILLNEAVKRGIKVPNKELLAFISGQPAFQRNGVFDKKIYEYILTHSLSLDPRLFEELVRENLKVKTLRGDIMKTSPVSDEDVTDFFKKTYDKVELSYFIIPETLFEKKSAAEDKEIREYYEKNREAFLKPEKIEVEYISLPYTNTTEKTSAARKAEQLYYDLTSGAESFAETAAKNGLKYDRPGVFSREDVLPGISFSKKFYDRAFSLEEGGISAPVFSSEEKGEVYVIHKLRDIPPVPEKFEDVKNSIAEKLKGMKASQAAFDAAEKAVKDRKTLEEAAAGFDQEIKTCGPVSSDGYIENVGSAAGIIPEALKNGEGKFVGPFTAKNGAFLARVNKIIPADPAALNDKKEMIRNNLFSRKQMDLMDKWFREKSRRVTLKKPLGDI